LETKASEKAAELQVIRLIHNLLTANRRIIGWLVHRQGLSNLRHWAALEMPGSSSGPALSNEIVVFRQPAFA
jgi:hypothetical protein